MYRLYHLFLPLACLLLASLHCSLAQATSPAERYIVLQLTRLGLANRLRTLADMHRIAILSKRKLLLSWKPTPDCNATFFDLFESAPEGFEVLPLVLEDGDAGIVSVKEMAAENGLSYEHVSMETLNKKGRAAAAAQGKTYDDINYFWPLDVFSSAVDVIHTSYDGVLSTTGSRCQDHMTMHSKFLRGLVPVSSIRETVDNIVSQYFQDRLPIGVHIRAHDEAYDWEVVPPASGQKKAQAFGQGATVAHFEAAMSKIADYFGPGRVRFFVASNLPAAKQHMQNRFEGSIALYGEESRSSRDGIQFALMEFLLLSQTSLLLHTFGSTFAMEAAQVNLRPLVGVFDGQFIRHTDITLRLCGNMHYMQHFSDNAHEVSYVEGTVDQREIRGKAVALTTCNEQLDHWGLPQAVCYS